MPSSSSTYTIKKFRIKYIAYDNDSGNVIIISQNKKIIYDYLQSLGYVVK